MNKALTESMNIGIWVVDANQLFIRGSYTKIKFSKSIKWQKSFYCDK